MEDKKLYGFLAIFVAVALWSGYNAYDPVLWWLEAGICVAGLAVLAITYKKFRLTNLTYFFILIHFVILFVGAHYSYARVPLFDWIQEWTATSRNNYDKVGHFAQGFVPALVIREVLLRLEVVRKTGWIPFFVVCICLAISAFYELIEWWIAILFETSAEDFLGMQGYEWDTQSDMLMAMIGAISMLLFLSKAQNKQLRKLKQHIEETSTQS